MAPAQDDTQILEMFNIFFQKGKEMVECYGLNYVPPKSLC